MSTDNRKATPADLDAIFRPVFERLLAQHGKTEAVRCFKRAVVAAGFDPRELRVLFEEDLS